MAASRTTNAVRNIFFGFINKFVVLVIPFITRTLVLRLLGAAFLGIGTLFSSILSFLSLTQAGIGSAIVYSMYKPLAEKDTEKICALLNYYKKLYRVLGLAVLTLGTVILPFVPFLMNGDAPDGINVYVLFYIYLLESVASYLFFGYKYSLIVADQRSDIGSNIHTVVNILVQFGKVLALCLTRNFYVYALVPIIGAIVNNVSIAVVTKKMYPEYVDRGEVGNDVKLEIRKKISGLFGSKLNSVIVHSADVMIISSFFGLAMAGKYGNYYYIMNAVCGFVSVLFSSLTAGIGNKIVTDGVDENYTLFKNLSFVNLWIVSWASVAFFCLYEPFIKLWLGEEMQLGIVFVSMFVFYFFIYEVQRTILSFKDALGLWHKDKLRPYVSMAVNFILNFILAHFIGIYGVVASTILSFFISFPWINHILFKNYFVKIKPSDNLLKVFFGFLVTVVACAVTYLPCRLLDDSWLSFAVRVIICITVPNVVFFVFYHKKKEYKYFVTWIRAIVTRIIKRKTNRG